MANNKRASNPKLYIEGVAVWPMLNKADTKWKPDGEKHTKLRVPAEVADMIREKARPVIDAELEAKREYLEDQQANGKDGKAKAAAKKALAALHTADLSITADVDDDGNETGDFLIKANTPVSYKSKKETDDEGNPKLIPIKLAICDAKGNVLAKPPLIYSGSKLCLAIELRPYFNAKDAAVGASLRLVGVQILELVTGGSGGGNPGFKAREGYEADADDGADDDTPDGADDDGQDEAPAAKSAPAKKKAGASEF